MQEAASRCDGGSSPASSGHTPRNRSGSIRNIICLPSGGYEGEGDAVDAEALAGGWRTIVEDMTEMRVAAGAADFGPFHAKGIVGEEEEMVRSDRLIEARPAGTGLELGPRAEERQIASGAAVFAFALVSFQLAGERALRRMPTHDGVLLRREKPLPFLFASCYLPDHDRFNRDLNSASSLSSLGRMTRWQYGSSRCSS